MSVGREQQPMTESSKWFAFMMVLLVLGLVYLLSPVLVPFLVAFLLAYFLDPLVTKLRRWKIPRIVSSFFVFLIFLGIVLTLVFTLLPQLEKQIFTFVQSIPAMLNWVQAVFVPWLSKVSGFKMQFNTSILKNAVLDHFQQHGKDLFKAITSMVFTSGHTLFEILMNVVLIPVVTLYLLIDWVDVTTNGKRLIPLPPAARETAVSLIRECGDVLAGFFRGQLLVMIGLGFVYSVGLSIVGLNMALLIGVLSGLFSIVPYLGFVTGILMALIAAVIQFHTWWPVIGVLIVFAIGEVCESFVFSPMFVGDRIGLHPVAVIFAVLAGGQLFGFVGVLLALPVAAVIMVFFRYLRRKYLENGQSPTEGDAPA
jgi:predicted PurR-regulated permease PerM